jgi:hypothetical protein
MTVFLDENGLVPALEQMTVPLMAFIEKLSINAVQLPHAYREIAVGGLNEQMVMVGHEAVGVAYPIVSLVDVLKGIEEIDTVLVILKNGFFLIPARGHVVDGAWIFDAKRACHELKIARMVDIVNSKDLTL